MLLTGKGILKTKLLPKCRSAELAPCALQAYYMKQVIRLVSGVNTILFHIPCENKYDFLQYYSQVLVFLKCDVSLDEKNLDQGQTVACDKQYIVAVDDQTAASCSMEKDLFLSLEMGNYASLAPRGDGRAATELVNLR